MHVDCPFAIAILRFSELCFGDCAFIIEFVIMAVRIAITEAIVAFAVAAAVTVTTITIQDH